jgi:hypothetical protein
MTVISAIELRADPIPPGHRLGPTWRLEMSITYCVKLRASGFASRLEVNSSQ